MVQQLWMKYRKTKSINIENQLIKYYLPTVKTIASHMAKVSVPKINFREIYCEGILGLSYAIKKYNPKRTKNFMSYANFRIRGAMIDFIRKNNKYTRNMARLKKQIEHAVIIAGNKLGRKPSHDEIANEMNISSNKLTEIKKHLCFINPVSLSQKYGDTEGDDFLMTIADNKLTSPIKKIIQGETQEKIINKIKKLPYKEKTFLIMFYFKDKTYKEIAKILKVSESRISQIKKNAIILLQSELGKYRAD